MPPFKPALHTFLAEGLSHLSEGFSQMAEALGQRFTQSLKTATLYQRYL